MGSLISRGDGYEPVDGFYQPVNAGDAYRYHHRHQSPKGNFKNQPSDFQHADAIQALEQCALDLSKSKTTANNAVDTALALMYEIRSNIPATGHVQ